MIKHTLNGLSKALAIAGALAIFPGVAAAENMLETSPQKPGDSVTVAKVSADQDSFLVIHDVDADGKVIAPASIGHVAVKAGTTEDVVVALDSVPEHGKVIAMLHLDTGKIGTYEFGITGTDEDKPVMVDGKPVVKPVILE